MKHTRKTELKKHAERFISRLKEEDLKTYTKKDLREIIYQTEIESELNQLRSKYEEMEETLDAIRTGNVDALVVSGDRGEKVYTLTGAEHPYRVMVETMGEGAVTLSHDGTILFTNMSFSKLVRLPMERIIGTSMTRYINPEDRSEFDSLLKRNKKGSRLETSLSVHNSKKRIPVFLSVSPLQNEQNLGYSVVITDLTHQKNEEIVKRHAANLQEEIKERNKIEQALKKSEERFRVAQDLSPDGFTILHPIRDDKGRVIDFTFVYENAAIARLNGTDPETVVGRSLLELFPGHQGSVILDTYRRVAKNGKSRIIEAHYQGESLPRALWLRIAVVSMGEDIAILAQDISERKQAEIEVREREQRLRIAADAAELGVFEWTMKEDEPIWENERMHEIFGISPSHKPLNLQEIRELIHPDDVKILERDLAESMRPGSFFRSEYRIRRESDKQWRWIESFGQFEFSPKGEPIRLIGVLRDITESKQMEEALRTYKDELEDRVRERTAEISEINKKLLDQIEERKRTEVKLRSAQKDLRAMASEIVVTEERARQHFATDLHDTVVQTLGAAKLRGQLIQDEIPDKAKPVFMQVQDMISQSITQSRQIMAELSPPVLNELGLIAALEWLTDQISSKNGINIKFRGRDEYEPIKHDLQVLLFQATRELLLNVVKHSGAQEASVSVGGDRKKIRIEVKDNGKGFDGKVAFRAESTGGFGLFSVKERLRHLGGQLAIYSKPGKGTRAVITAPKILDIIQS